MAVGKKAAQKFDVERFNLSNLSELKVKKKYQLNISNSFAALENSHDSEVVNRARDNIKRKYQNLS